MGGRDVVAVHTPAIEFVATRLRNYFSELHAEPAQHVHFHETIVETFAL